jgi:hypothetical protein
VSNQPIFCATAKGAAAEVMLLAHQPTISTVCARAPGASASMTAKAISQRRIVVPRGRCLGSLGDQR